LLTSRAPYRSWAANLAPAAEALLQARERLILALDFRSAAAGFDFLKNLRETTPSDHCLQWVKVGLELYLASGPSLVERLIADGYKVFLDLKLHDIPNTVAGAVRSVLPLGPALLTVHAVTVLTSMSAQQLEAIGVSNTPARQVERLAAMADDSGIHGLVCSPLEVSRLRALLPAAHLVTPGVRPAGAEHGDQQRVSTPWDAIRRGASQLVVGRPITQAVDPAAACVAILQEIAAAL
jgi:orotidine-5'-phosphate decarboxylase